ncbi:MAG TPA: hypothetical protein PK878_18155 [bacterium]|nr:hypothetical protein [Candidatus Omnitrophota bacterium]HOJ62209.1 hypothetical protein [bacterium]HOL94907.1 hypothetical protein [bacterium]HPP01202.1 hypothetical protein [bacterium]HXK93667.1 hypothetical protein [bacterium]
MGAKQDRALLRVKWLYTVRRWKRLNLDSILRSSGFLLLVGVFWFLCYVVVARLCQEVTKVDVVGPIVLERIISFGFLAVLIIIVLGHLLTAYSSLFRGMELPTLFSSPYPIPDLYRIQCLEALILGGWVSGVFCVPIILAYGWELKAAWWYYPAVVVGLIGFLITAGLMGILGMLFIARWIIGRALRMALGSVLVLAGFTGIILYISLTNKILLSNVDVSKLGETLANLRLSSYPYVPSQWMTQVMQSAYTGKVGRMLFYLALLWSSALFLWHVALELGYRWYADAWLWAQERVRLVHRRPEGRRFRKKRLWLKRLIPGRVGAVLFKEVHVFARDFSQWGQLVLILALVLFYVAHTQNIMFDEPDSRIRNQMAFINVILLGFIQATLSLRFSFPSISLEGKAFWTIQSAGIGLPRFFFTKYYLHALVLLCIGQGMGYMLNRILGVDSTLQWLSIFVLFLFAFGFTSWTMGFGAVFHKFEATNAADVTSDTGALVTMILTLLYFASSVVVVGQFVLNHIPGTDLAGQFAMNPNLILFGALFLLLQTFAILIPPLYGLRKLEEAVI